MKKLINKIFGKKYYANIINTIGTDRCEITSCIFPSMEQAKAHEKRIMATASFRFIETVSFRSRINY